MEQKLSTDPKTIAGGTINYDNLIKIIVCVERQKYEQTAEEHQDYKTNISTRFRVVFEDDKIINPKAKRKTTIMILNKSQPVVVC